MTPVEEAEIKKYIDKKTKEKQNNSEELHQIADSLVERYHIWTIEASSFNLEEVWCWYDGYYHKNGEAIIRAEVLSPDSVYKDGDLRQIISYVKARTTISRDKLKQIPYCVNLKNGILDYSDTKNIKFIPRIEESDFHKYNFTYILPVNYDPNVQCSEIELTLQQILVDKFITESTLIKLTENNYFEQLAEDHQKEKENEESLLLQSAENAEINNIEFPEEYYKIETKKEENNEKLSKIRIIEEYLGSVLMSEYEIKKALLLVGKNDTGKSTILNIIERFIGAKNYCTVSLQDLDTRTNRFAGSRLDGKIANIVDEMPSVSQKNYDIFKAATGGASVSVEKKGKDGYNIESNAKMLFTANELPQIHPSVRRSVYNRMVIVECVNIFSSGEKSTDTRRKNKTYSDEELSGLLNIAIRGLKRLLKNGEYNYNNEDTPTLWEKHQDNSSPVLEFINEEFEITKNYKVDFVFKDHLYKEYKIYCVKKNIELISIKKFGIDISNISGIKSEHRTDPIKSFKENKQIQNRAWIGLRKRESLSISV